MKKMITLLFGLMATMTIHAQSEFPAQFADKDGNIIADGSTLTLTETETDAFGMIQMPTGLYVKNTTDQAAQIGGVYTIVSISSGSFQSCPFNSCTAQSTPGEYETANGQMTAGELQFLMSEWFPEAEGTCKVTYQLRSYKKNPITGKSTKDKDGPKITLNFNYSTTAVKNVVNGKQVSTVEYFNLTGKRVNPSKHGMYIVKTTYADGTTKTVKRTR